MKDFPFQPAENVEQVYKHCKTCMRQFPREMFKENLSSTDGRDCCPDCRAVGATRQQRLIRQKYGDGQEAIKNFISKIRAGALPVPDISELCAEMYKRFGGLEAFSVAYYQQILEAQKAKPGSKTVLDAYKSLVQLTQMSTQHRQSVAEATDMNDDEIEAEIYELLPRLLPPEMVVDGEVQAEETPATPPPSEGEAA